MKRLLATLLLLAATGTAAAQSCGGNLIAVRDVHRDPSGQNRASYPKVGELQVYYNPANGNNCARMMHAGSTWDVPRYTWIALGTCAPSRRNDCLSGTHRTFQNGVYRFQAGPVRRAGRGKCLAATGMISSNTRQDGTLYSTSVAGFCR